MGPLGPLGPLGLFPNPSRVYLRYKTITTILNKSNKVEFFSKKTSKEFFFGIYIIYLENYSIKFGK
jgi:hypothetical protein